MKNTFALFTLLALTAGGSAVHAQARLKDIGVVQGVRSNQLIGYGLVIGLDGTGDGTGSSFTPQAVASMLAKFGVNSSAASMKLKNVAAVMVTASLPAFVKNGSTIDVTVSSLGDAKSLQGGTLLQTPLQAADGKVYAAAQGSVSVGGFVGGGGAGGSVTKNHVTAGRIPAGALVEQEVPMTFAGAEAHSVSVILNQPDFTTAVRAAKAIARHLPLGATGARAMDAGTIQVDFALGADTVNMIAELEDTPVDTDEVAKIVVNERTGTVVMGGNATITPCAIAHGNLTISVTNDPIISQPAPLSGGKTVVEPRKIIQTKEGDNRLMKVTGGTTLDKVVKSLNALGVTPRDLISILQAMKEAGALHAEIEVL
ncbi:MAG: flagellar basal body P-ring protein FlgI [Capsulimonas sp.]|uniref:flagellar basal body P-ring protein FlgI n=1 Tax=Capsulimonas sp. TaxID=2494211 RepID=UPI0032662A80